jgi:hypothetical protein
LSYSPLDSCVDLDGLSGHDRPRVQNMTEMKIIICLLTKIFNAQLGFESRAIQDGVLTMLSLYTKQLVRNLSTTSP